MQELCQSSEMSKLTALFSKVKDKSTSLQLCWKFSVYFCAAEATVGLALSHADTLHAARAHLLGFGPSSFHILLRVPSLLLLCAPPSPLPPLPPSPMLYKPNPVSWQCGERAVGLCLCLCSLGFLFFFFFFTECFSRAEIVWVVPALPHPSDHASAWCYVPSDLRRSLTHSSIHWLLLLWLFITNTTAKARSMAVYAFKS